MRKVYTSILKQFFYMQLIHTRTVRCLTQVQMASLLAMDERSYVELDHGKSCCSAVTLALFLVYGCTDPETFLDQLHIAFEEAKEHVT